LQIKGAVPGILELGQSVRSAILESQSDAAMREVSGLTDSGDASFNVDLMAERIVQMWLEDSPMRLAAYTEDLGFVSEYENPEYVLVVDPLDGSRAFRAGLETCCVSIAVARFNGKAETRFSDIVEGYLWEVKGDAVFAARAGQGVEITMAGRAIQPQPAPMPELKDMAWAFEVCARPAKELFEVLGDLINGSAVRGGCFLFNSTTFALTRIVLGNLNAFIDVGVRIVEELPGSVAGLIEAGQLQVLGLFPYDIAAAYIIAQEFGLTMTDGYGRSLDERPLLGSGPETRLSCIAAQNSLLHEQIMRYIDGQFANLLHRQDA